MFLFDENRYIPFWAGWAMRYLQQTQYFPKNHVYTDYFDKVLALVKKVVYNYNLLSTEPNQVGIYIHRY